ncbi:DDE-type integrase/transposase/recombinase, partial [Paraburkholderia youngii]|uniref:DDE-type integrase/transposase/recombinase n=1 Tax=Paraburkholderia youngii TaxID=2782701 RepID=UPI0020D0ED3F
SCACAVHPSLVWLYMALFNAGFMMLRFYTTRSIFAIPPSGQSRSNLAALQAINARREVPIRVRQKKYLNNIIEQDHRAIKRRTRPMPGFEKFRCARILLGGIEVMHMIVKGQLNDGGVGQTPAQQFYLLAG